jgi:hypothetical protein
MEIQSKGKRDFGDRDLRCGELARVVESVFCLLPFPGSKGLNSRGLALPARNGLRERENHSPVENSWEFLIETMHMLTRNLNLETRADWPSVPRGTLHVLA